MYTPHLLIYVCRVCSTCDDEGYSDEVEAVRFVLAVVTVEDTLEVDETIADAASNGNTLVAMAAAVEGGVGWIRRGFVAATVVVEALEVVLELVGSLPRRTWPPPTFLSSLGFEGATLSSSSHGQMASLVVALKNLCYKIILFFNEGGLRVFEIDRRVGVNILVAEYYDFDKKYSKFIR